MSETTRTVTPSSAIKAIKEALKVKRPIMIYSAPGCGKSDIIHQIGKELNRPVIDMRLALYDPSDLKGFPYYDPSSNDMRWAPSAELPKDPNSNAILFLDELVSAAPSTQAAAYQLVLNRRIGEYVLPQNVDIVAAGNRASDRGVVYKMPSPLANRFVHLELKIDVDEWIDWALKKGLHKDVVGYISHMKQDLFTFDPKSSSHAFATPRTWEFVSQFLESESDVGEETTLDLISGTIGDGLAIKHSAFRKTAAKLPKAMDILQGKVNKLDTKEIGALYSLVISLAYELKELHTKKDKNFWKYMDQCFDFQMTHMPVELNIMSAKTLLKNFNVPIEPDKMKNFEKFYKQYGKYIFATVS
jgi:midasin (ATPase involved in ribosome maturation)